jgi:acid phosphatase family membrane protein YuiD
LRPPSSSALSSSINTPATRPKGFDPAYFALLEAILIIVIAAMFYFYSKNSDR